MRGLGENLSKVYQDQMEHVIQISDAQGKLSGNLTEQWGQLDLNISTMKADFKKEIEENRLNLETEIEEEKVKIRQLIAEIEVEINKNKAEFDKEVTSLEGRIGTVKAGISTDLDVKIKTVTEVINKLGADEVSVAVENLKNFSSRVHDLEDRVEEMEHLVEEHPREWQNNLLLHGIEEKEDETFFSLATIVSRIIR